MLRRGWISSCLPDSISQTSVGQLKIDTFILHHLNDVSNVSWLISHGKSYGCQYSLYKINFQPYNDLHAWFTVSSNDDDFRFSHNTGMWWPFRCQISSFSPTFVIILCDTRHSTTIRCASTNDVGCRSCWWRWIPKDT